jgi:hypothetical protein
MLREEVVDALAAAAEKVGRLEDREVRALGLRGCGGEALLELGDPSGKRHEFVGCWNLHAGTS